MTKSLADGVNLQDPAFLEDPYPVYEKIRNSEPVCWSELFGGAWLLMNHADVKHALLDGARLSSAREIAALRQFPSHLRSEYDEIERFYSNIMLVFDGEHHAQVRRLVQDAFTPSRVEDIRSLVYRIVEELLAPHLARGTMDLVQDLAYPLPAYVIAELMGLPWSDSNLLKGWADDLALFIGGATNPTVMASIASNSMKSMADYFESHIRQRRQDPSDDLISKLLNVRSGQDQLSHDRVWAQCLLLLTAGHQTTRDLISGGIWHLLQNPDQFARLYDNPDLVETAVDECLRFDAPVQLAGRIATEDFEIGGKAIHRGERVISVLGSANRDGEKFPDANRFIVDRKPNPHLAFGAGPHICLGAFLANLEAEVAFDVMVKRMPNLRTEVERPERMLNATFRRITRLPIRWDPPSPSSRSSQSPSPGRGAKKGDHGVQ